MKVLPVDLLRIRARQAICFAFIAALFGAFSVSTCNAAGAPPSPRFLNEINELTRQSVSLVKKRDYTGLVRLEKSWEMPIFTITYANGRILNADQQHKYELVARKRILSFSQFSKNYVSFTPVGSDYIVESLEQESGTFEGTGDAVAPFKITVRLREYWVKQGATWKLGGAEELAKSQTYGGRTDSVTANSGLSY